MPSRPVAFFIKVITKLPNSEQSYKGKVQTHNYINRQNQSTNRLLDQGYKKIRLIRSLKKFIFRYQYLVEIYSVSAEKIISDAFSYSENVCTNNVFVCAVV
jgi:hypothetical protein